MAYNKKAIGYVFIVIGLFLLLSYYVSSKGGGGIFQKNDKKISCDITFDADSVITSNCNTIGTCNVGFPFFLGIGQQDTVVRIVSNGISYDSEKITTTFYINERINMGACVPGTANTVDIQVLNEQGVIEDSKTVNI